MAPITGSTCAACQSALALTAAIAGSVAEAAERAGVVRAWAGNHRCFQRSEKGQPEGQPISSLVPGVEPVYIAITRGFRLGALIDV
jgi:uncharacterized membrane protein